MSRLGRGKNSGIFSKKSVFLQDLVGCFSIKRGKIRAGEPGHTNQPDFETGSYLCFALFRLPGFLPPFQREDGVPGRRVSVRRTCPPQAGNLSSGTGRRAWGNEKGKRMKREKVKGKNERARLGNISPYGL
jgi:hypothetical protein